MKHNFKCRFLRTVYGLLLSPHNTIAMIFSLTIATVFMMGLISPATALLLFGVELAVLLVIKRHSAPEPLTECFARYPVPGTAWSVIGQRRPACGMSCRDTLRALAREPYILPDRIPPGRYRTVTHDTVLRRIETADGLRLLRVKSLGIDNLKSIHGRMRGSDCRRCAHKDNCRFSRMIEEPRQFYYIEFEKVE